MLVEAHPCVEREIRADTQEHATPILVAQIEVVLPHEARVDLDTVATPGCRVADRDASVFTALQDDCHSEARAEAVIERFNPLFATYALGRLDDLHVLRCGQAT